MKMIYIVQGQSTGINGNIIHWADSAYTDEQKASYARDKMHQILENDPNGMVYITGPIPLDETEELA